jgi:hypothetical protein
MLSAQGFLAERDLSRATVTRGLSFSGLIWRTVTFYNKQGDEAKIVQISFLQNEYTRMYVKYAFETFTVDGITMKL